MGALCSQLTISRSSGGALNVSDADAALQIGKKENILAWKAGMKFNSGWNGQQRTNCNRLLKVRDLDEHKHQQKAFFQKTVEELEEYIGSTGVPRGGGESRQ